MGPLTTRVEAPIPEKRGFEPGFDRNFSTDLTPGQNGSMLSSGGDLGDSGQALWRTIWVRLMGTIWVQIGCAFYEARHPSGSMVQW